MEYMQPQPGEWWAWDNDPQHPFVIKANDGWDVTYAYMHLPGSEYSLPVDDMMDAARKVVSA
jgi:hypothetical protein